MSQNHNPPRQNVHRARKPVTTSTSIQFRGGTSKANKRNAEFNRQALRASGPAQGATPGQIVVTIKMD